MTAPLVRLLNLLRPGRRRLARQQRAERGSGNVGWKAEGYGTPPKSGDLS